MRRRWWSAVPALLAAAWLLQADARAAASAHDAPLAVRFAPEKDYGPFVFVDGDDRLRGLSIDLLQSIQQHARLQIDPLPAAPLAEQLLALREGRADLVSSLRPTPERAAYLAFSLPYVSVPAILVRRADGPKPTEATASVAAAGLAALAGRRVAVGAAYAVESFVRSRYPAVAWVAVSDDLAALEGVTQGRYAGAVVDAASASFIQRRHNLRGLQSVGPVGFDYVLSFAVPRHRQDLLTRIDNGIRAVSAAERLAIVERWMTPLDDPGPLPSRWQSMAVRGGLGLIALAAVAGLALLLRHRLGAAAARRATNHRRLP